MILTEIVLSRARRNASGNPEAGQPEAGVHVKRLFS